MRNSKQIKIGNVLIGGNNKIAIQSMCDTKTSDVASTIEQIACLEKVGCNIVRVAVPDELSAKSIKLIKNDINIPLVADIHFNSKLAVQAIENGADKVRINPGNMQEYDLLRVISCAKMHNTPIRIGVNSGSLNKEYLSKYNKIDALCNTLTDYVKFFEQQSFYNLVLAIKSSSVMETVQANRRIATLFDYPLHIGVTEAGITEIGQIKNAIGIGSLLLDGIGDTIRVSLTDNPIKEIETAKLILSSLNLSGGVEFVSCPKCGRCSIDLDSIARQVYNYVSKINKNIKVAVMGCEVNGPGECADADIGLAGGNGKVAFFKKGKVYKIVDESDAVQLFTEEIDKL